MRGRKGELVSDLIDRQKAITAILEDGTWLERQGCTEITMCERKQRDADILSELPTIEAEPVRHGRWIEHKDYPGLAYLCSECGYFTTVRSYFCPYCGTKMDGERRTDE